MPQGSWPEGEVERSLDLSGALAQFGSDMNGMPPTWVLYPKIWATLYSLYVGHHNGYVFVPFKAAFLVVYVAAHSRVPVLLAFVTIDSFPVVKAGIWPLKALSWVLLDQKIDLEVDFIAW